MLYDNGPLLALYAEAFLASGEKGFADVANETADWMLADMLAPNGGFYSTRDADSEGEEGLYYIWTPEEVSKLVDESNVEALSQRFGLDQDANFEGKWHLTVRNPRRCSATAAMPFPDGTASSTSGFRRCIRFS